MQAFGSENRPVYQVRKLQGAQPPEIVHNLKL